MCPISIILFSSSLTSSHEDLGKCCDEKLAVRVTILINLKELSSLFKQQQVHSEIPQGLKIPYKPKKCANLSLDDPEEGPELTTPPSLKWRRLGGHLEENEKRFFISDCSAEIYFTDCFSHSLKVTTVIRGGASVSKHYTIHCTS